MYNKYAKFNRKFQTNDMVEKILSRKKQTNFFSIVKHN